MRNQNVGEKIPQRSVLIMSPCDNQIRNYDRHMSADFLSSSCVLHYHNNYRKLVILQTMIPIGKIDTVIDMVISNPLHPSISN